MAFKWRLVMPDGGFHDEHANGGEHLRWDHQKALVALALWLIPNRSGLNNITILRRHGQAGSVLHPSRLQFYRRTQIEVAVFTAAERGRQVVTIAGIETDDGSGRFASGAYLFAFDDGSVLMSDDLHAV